jgi:hypothetical protein
MGATALYPDVFRKGLSIYRSGYNSDVISAINYVAKQVKITKRPSVINMSLGSPGYLPLDKAVNSVSHSLYIFA